VKASEDGLVLSTALLIFALNRIGTSSI